ncbi:MAG TPA: fibronectin type III domain-containing protein, partial [Mycobacterium sp.]|nr:fibronectin type III domain-containing protein [Mycobacterium sp.]
MPAVPLSPVAETDFGTMIAELAALGHNRNDRKYLVWFDSDPRNSSYCGIGTVYVDDRPTGNSNDASVGYARADYLCWNWTEAHELMHTLGAVQPTAPHATAGLHCTDEYDHMCYQDSPTAVMNHVCPTSYEQLFDCGHDDYFHTSPAANNYLATHWNTADSGWLITAETDVTPPVVERPDVSFPAGQKLTATARVRVGWSDGSDESGIAAYELQRRKGSGSWVAVPLSTPTARSVEVDLEVSATYTFRLRARDGAGNTGDWATTAPATLTLLQ